MKILVYGGTGSQARPTVTHLMKRGHLPYVLTRSNDKAADLREAGANAIVADMRDFDQLCAASNDMDAVAFLLPAFWMIPTMVFASGKTPLPQPVVPGSEYLFGIRVVRCRMMTAAPTPNSRSSAICRRRQYLTSCSNPPRIWKTGWVPGQHLRCGTRMC